MWIPANDCQELGDRARPRAAYLDGLFPARYAHMTEAFLASAPAMARFVAANTGTGSSRAPAIPTTIQDAQGRRRAAAASTCSRPTYRDGPAGPRVRVPPGYLPMTLAEWERWRYPSRFDWDLLRMAAAGIRANGVALAAALVDGVIRAGARIETGARLVEVITGHRNAGPGRASGRSRGAPGPPAPASAVVLACGGFDWDESLRRAWHPAAQRATGASPGNCGDALRIARRLGARTDNLGQGWWMPMMAVPGEEVDGVLLVASSGSGRCPGRSWSTRRAAGSLTRRRPTTRSARRCTAATRVAARTILPDIRRGVREEVLAARLLRREGPWLDAVRRVPGRAGRGYRRRSRGPGGDRRPLERVLRRRHRPGLRPWRERLRPLRR